MKGELAEKVLFDYGSVLSKPVVSRPASKLYASPLVHDSFTKGDNTIHHNPFKSDVYSLGLVML